MRARAQRQQPKSRAVRPVRIGPARADDATHPLTTAQQSFGNQATLRTVQAMQASGSGVSAANHPLLVGRQNVVLGRPGDANEQEAARIADTMLASPAGQPWSRAPESTTAAASSAGQPLAATTRQFMETRFGRDFSGVRLHSGAAAAASARALNARAYTVGEDIVFGTGHFAPGSQQGRHLLAHELAHVAQYQSGRAPAGLVQRAPDNTIEVDLVEVSTAESDLLFHDVGIKLPGSPPRVNFGNDGAIPEADRKAVQLGFDLAYRTAASPSFAAKLGQFKAGVGKQKDQIPGIADISQEKYLQALNRLSINLADTSKNPGVVKLVQDESKGGGTPTAGFTPVGSQQVYLRGFALKEGRDALGALILHEAFHVAGVPSRPITELPNLVMETGVHGFEASVGLPMSQIEAKTARLTNVKPLGAGLEFTVNIIDPDQLSSDVIDIDVVDGNRKQVFSVKRPAKKLTERFVWNGHDRAGKETESGIHSIRVRAGAALFAAQDVIIRRTKP